MQARCHRVALRRRLLPYKRTTLVPCLLTRTPPASVAFLVVKSGNHTLALSLDTPEGKPAESMRPALESLMKTVLTRLP
jgi:hypothetical protein